MCSVKMKSEGLDNWLMACVTRDRISGVIEKVVGI